jgi:hypothetical protein
MFKKGKHAYTSKYARFMKRQEGGKIRNSRVKRTSSYIVDESGEALEVSPGVFLPSRSSVQSKKRSGAGLLRPLGFLASLRLVRWLVEGAYAVNERLKSARRAQEAALLGYIPLRIFVGVSVMTLGLYPYFWVWGNVCAFTKVCGGRVREGELRRFAVTGFCVQLTALFSAVSCLWWMATGSPWAYEMALQTSVFFAAAYVLIVLPMRCSSYFDLRWNMRSAVAMWDRKSIMMDRTMTSWAKLFMLGSAYIQFHVNRLMGLGMPGFADAEEITDDFSFGEWVRDYIRAKSPDIRDGDDDYDEMEEPDAEDEPEEDGEREEDV